MSDVPVTELDGLTSDDDYDVDLLAEVADCQIETDELNQKAAEEMLLVESKYNKLRQPYFKKRGELTKKVPNFWIISIINHPKISSVLDAEEEDCLRFLSNLKVEQNEDIKSGYRITFHFDENPYFENKELTKEFFWRSISNSTPINWKKGKNLLEQVLMRPHRTDKDIYSVYKSFFDWFSDDADINDDEVAITIKDDLWQNPLRYYLRKDTEEPEDGQEEETEKDDEEEGK